MLIKLCGFKDPETAHSAALLGADFIGIVFHPGSSRCVSVELGREIALAVKEGGAQPVALFVNKTSGEITELCQETGIDIVQAYGTREGLPAHLQRIYVNAPEAPIRPGLDFLLMETSHPGSGQRLHWDTFVPPKQPHWFLAGGLNPDNVREAIQKLHPLGVDAATGIEVDGQKQIGLIQEFIEKVRDYGC